MSNAKPYEIPKRLVWNAWLAVKANRGAAGVDGQTIDDFEANLEKGLYKIWNRMSSGSYMPPMVKRVEIVKSDGKMRPLGIPTVADRIAQMVVKSVLEPQWDPHFHPSSFGYRPRKSAHDAVRQAKANCWKYSWVIDLDIKGFFDNLDHDLLMKAVRHKTDNAWAILYIERWLKAGIVFADATCILPQKGTPLGFGFLRRSTSCVHAVEGGVISPLLANLFLHVVFDQWMHKYYPAVLFERYADDIVVHCATRTQAEKLHDAIAQRMAGCGLSLHPDKTKVVCCDPKVKANAEFPTQFDFLGFTFRKRAAKRRDGKLFTGFSPAISNKAKKAIVRKMRDWQVHKLATETIVGLSKRFNAQIRGWLNYYGAFYPSALSHLLYTLDLRLINWARSKYRKQSDHFMRAVKWLGNVKKRCPKLFAHWAFMSS